MNWPLRTALEAYRMLLRRDTLEDYNARRLEWAVLAPHQKAGSRNRAPEPPPLLKGRR